MAISIADLRNDYTQRGLSEADVHEDPLVQFQTWFEAAHDSGVQEVNAMTLATATPDGRPSARIVLLKGVDDGGFVFYTNYNSRKGDELAANPWAALVFFWRELEQQVRIEGTISKVSTQESDAYFHSRPEGSRLGAWASPQSNVIPSADVISANLERATARFADKPLERPSHWGGYRLTPVCLEFWQGRPSRLHDRLRYTVQPNGTWLLERLAP